MNYNQVILVGRLTADPKIKECKDGNKRASFTLAVNNDSAKSKEANFLNVVAWKNIAEVAENYLSKGKMILIDGQVKQRSYEVDDQKKNIVEIVAQRIKFLEKKEAA